MKERAINRERKRERVTIIEKAINKWEGLEFERLKRESKWF